MPSKPLQTDGASRISGEGTLPERKLSLRQRVFDEIVKFLAIACYLWVMFGVFALHESVVSEKDHINYQFYGFAVINALILGKVMLVAEDLHFADWFKDRPLVYPILCKAVAFSILFLVFDVVEEVLVGLFRGKTIAESIPSIGGGSPSGVIFVGIILAVALIPFFTFREVGRAIGERELHALLSQPAENLVRASPDRSGESKASWSGFINKEAGMADAQTGASAVRFEVRVTADSHFAWLLTRLALERTMMAWLRTAVSLIGFGFAIVQFFEHLQHMPGVRPAEYPHAAQYLGLALISCGVLAL
jgi:uncharacterized membrane protein YobD (UPF0266 family)